MTSDRANRRLKDLKKVLRPMIPLASLADFNVILEKSSAGHLRHLPPSIAAWQAVSSFVRHTYTEYDALLVDGYDADSARHFVLADMNEKLLTMGCTKVVSDEEN